MLKYTLKCHENTDRQMWRLKQWFKRFKYLQCVGSLQWFFSRFTHALLSCTSHPQHNEVWSNFLPEFISIFSRRQMEINYTLVFTNLCHPSWRPTANQLSRLQTFDAQWSILIWFTLCFMNFRCFLRKMFLEKYIFCSSNTRKIRKIIFFGIHMITFRANQ